MCHFGSFHSDICVCCEWKPPECHSVECHSSECHSAEFHSAEFHSAKYEESVVVRIKSNLLLMSFCLHIINYNS